MSILEKLFPKGRRFLYFEYPGIWICNFWYWITRQPIRKTIWEYKEVHYLPVDEFKVAFDELREFQERMQAEIDKQIGILNDD